MRVFISYKQQVDPDHDFARHLERFLRQQGHGVFRDETGITPGEKWPERLRQEIRRCEVVLALISNASLQSDWFRTELNYARDKEKPIVPVLLQAEGQIDEALKFTMLHPFFGHIQWYTATGDRDADVRAVAGMLPTVPRIVYRSTVERVLLEHGVTDGTELMAFLLWLLSEFHIMAKVAGSPGYHDCLEGLTSRRAVSVAESLRNLAVVVAAMNRHNADNRSRAGDEKGAKQFTRGAMGAACLGDLLSAAITGWDEEAQRRGQLLRRAAAESRRNESNS